MSVEAHIDLQHESSVRAFRGGVTEFFPLLWVYFFTERAILGRLLGWVNLEVASLQVEQHHFYSEMFGARQDVKTGHQAKRNMGLPRDRVPILAWDNSLWPSRHYHSGRRISSPLSSYTIARRKNLESAMA